MKPLVTLLLVLALASCGNADDNGRQEVIAETESSNEIPGKPLFSRWRSISGNGTLLDLRGGDFNNTLTLPIKIDVLVTCDCMVFITGSERSGTMRVSNCFDRAGNTDRYNCRNLEGYIGYNNPHSTLRLSCINKLKCGLYR